MASLSALRLLVALAVCLLLMSALASAGAKNPQPRKHKKFDPDTGSSSVAKTKSAAAATSSLKLSGEHLHHLLRSPRQAGAERRQYYPCINCFRIGNREICTSPFCPDNYQCDRPTKRCHKKPNVRGTPTADEEDQPAPAAPAAPAAQN